MQEDRFANGLQQFTIHVAPRVSSFAQPIADAEMELTVGDDLVQGAVIELYVYGMISTAGTQTDQRRIGSALISKLCCKYFISHGDGLWRKL